MRVGTAGIPDAELSLPTELRRAIAVDPSSVDDWCAMGSHLIDRREEDAAIGVLRRAAAATNDDPRIHSDIGVLLSEFDLGAACREFRRGLSVAPGNSSSWHNLGNASNLTGNGPLSASCMRRTLAIDPGASMSESTLLLVQNYDDHATDRQIYATYRSWAKRLGTGRERVEFVRDADPNRRLRIGYLSSEFRTHVVARTLLPLLQNHDPHAVEVYAYADVPQPDPTTWEFKRHVHVWRDIANRPNPVVAQQMRADRLDVLVLIAPHIGSERAGICVPRAAPVQVSQYAVSTTGLDEIDYWLTDEFQHGPSATEIFSETLFPVRSFSVFQTPMDVPHGEPPSVASGRVTFGSFNNLLKLNPAVAEVWTRILRQLPGARLVVGHGHYEGQGTAYVSSLFEACGLPAEQLFVDTQALNEAEHFARLAELDIALDTFPFGGTNTSFEALWMGLPVVTLVGSRAAGRVAASYNALVGLPELNAETPDRYVEIAVSLARTPGRLQRIRRELRSRLLASPLCDGPAYARSLEAAYREMWRRWCERTQARGQSPAD